MNSSLSVAANLSNDARKGLAILSLSKAETIAHLADREGVSQQFLYRQKQKAVEALDEAFAGGFVAWMLVSEDCPVQRISCDAHADRTSEFQHAVEHLDRDFDLTHATRVFT
jgi:hypothetical protein